MPGKQISDAAAEPCRRCKDDLSALIVRSEPLCQSVGCLVGVNFIFANQSASKCFAKYVHTKCIKRLETFKATFSAANQQRKVALALSFGIASATLLHVLDLHLKTQKSKTGRTGFTIHAILIEDSDQTSHAAELLHRARLQYPDHEYTSLPLHHVLELLPDHAPLRQLISHDEQQLAPQEQIAQFLNTLPSATARADVLATLRTRLIVEHAKRSGCESIMWGDSTTRLAEKTLAETAKGRAFSLPWQLADGVSPLGVDFHYPLRDLLKKELVSYVDLAEPELALLVQRPSLVTPAASMSSKNTTLDQLMIQYFDSVEQNFPSIVSNVVRTMGKLEVPTGATADPQCSLCSMPVHGGRFGIHGWGGDQEERDDSLSTISNKNLCYGCARAIP